jgi:hypothetical protein
MEQAMARAVKVTAAQDAPQKAAAKPAGKGAAKAPAVKTVAKAAKSVSKPARAAPARAAKAPAKAPAKAAKPVKTVAAAAKAAAKKAAATKAPRRAAQVGVPRASTPEAAAAPAKPVLVRDSFTMPEGEYAVLARVKQACLKAGIEVKKSELLRIGVALLGQIDVATVQAVLASLPQLKTGRPPSR